LNEINKYYANENEPLWLADGDGIEGEERWRQFEKTVPRTPEKQAEIEVRLPRA
jgi:hypothetical protein